MRLPKRSVSLHATQSRARREEVRLLIRTPPARSWLRLPSRAPKRPVQLPSTRTFTPRVYAPGKHTVKAGKDKPDTVVAKAVDAG